MKELDLVLIMGALVALLALAARRLLVPYPVLLVLGGLALGFVPGLPPMELKPEVVFLIFLPPLLFYTAWFTSWRDFRKYFRSIFFLAVGLVVATAAAVAWTFHTLTGLPWAVGFVLGAIVSPPDAIAASAIAQRVGLPRRVVALLEGESLVNDATGLVIYSFALEAVGRGTFSLPVALVNFTGLVFGGLLVGLVLGAVAAALFRWFDDAYTGITFSLLLPYVAYLTAERLHVSGVLSVVACGLFLGRRSAHLIQAKARLPATAFWDALVFLLNGVVFVLIGLQLQMVFVRLGGSSHFGSLLTWCLMISGVVILVRIPWCFLGAYLPHWLSPRVRTTESRPTWRSVCVVAWTGMRGVVSIAAALAIPHVQSDGSSFPGRDLVILLAFGAIFSTLVLQGLSLPYLVRWLGVRADRQVHEEENQARLVAHHAALSRLEAIATRDGACDEAINRLQQSTLDRLKILQRRADGRTKEEDPVVLDALLLYRHEMIAAERQSTVALRDQELIGDEALRAIEHELDLEEARLEAAVRHMG